MLLMLVPRFGPRPSQRPSRASWQFTNFAHFLSLSQSYPRPRPRPRPWAIDTAGNANNRTNPKNKAANNLLSPLTVFIRPPSCSEALVLEFRNHKFSDNNHCANELAALV